MNINGWIKSLIMLATSDDIQYNGMIIVKFVIMFSVGLIIDAISYFNCDAKFKTCYVFTCYMNVV